MKILRLRQDRQADRVAAADIERQPLGLPRERRGEECVCRVIDIQKVAALLAAPYLERGALGSVRIGRCRRIITAHLDAFAAEREQQRARRGLALRGVR